MNGIRYVSLILFPLALGGVILVCIKIVDTLPSKLPIALLSIILAIILLFFWYKAGRSFAENFRDLRVAVLIGNGLPIILTILYIWQTVFTPYEEANAFLVRLAHLYFAPLFVTLEMAVLPIGSSAVSGVQRPPVSVIAQITFLILFIWIFARGYLSAHGHCNRKTRYRR
ncbi:hypothetical protein RBG61_09220 [Paludicola sp. MB14-C6]|uniref:hypothetical protein n=1 Tax=Paludihabitans sp. MB14-C6 TaxID=3070656 RepID=UPI0027DC0A94|nr:hypothetical protein [Paludicola sp. MB14-C6]WMJ22178.1 hypothetical protein RBG61_09220 [Paludicola sp. MB14-C6]